MTNTTTRYADLGVDAGKGTVRKAFGAVIDNDYPGAFVNIIHDPSSPGTVVTQHGDGDGSKSIQRLIAFWETGDPTWLEGAVDDGISMNTGDVGASGFVSGFTTWTDNLNVGMRVDKELKNIIMNMFAQRFGKLRDLYTEHGFMVKFLGGETADLPDQIASSVFDVTVNAREAEANIIKGNVVPGDVIYGFASDGQARWEDKPNSGIMSNGLTLAGTCLGWSGYNTKYPNLRLKNPFTGKFQVGDTNPCIGNMTVFEALTSPTRQWALLIRMLVKELQNKKSLHLLHGISMNTGGGANKIGNVGNGIIYHKKMLPPPDIFHLIQREGEVSWGEMFGAFNCGVGLDIVGEDHLDFRDALCVVSEKTEVTLCNLGHTERNPDEGNKVVLDISCVDAKNVDS